MYNHLRKLFIGRPLHNRELAAEHLQKWKALSIFSSDALSSIGYGPEQIAITLAVPGLLLYGYIGYVAAAVLLLLAIVTISYVQVSQVGYFAKRKYCMAVKLLSPLYMLSIKVLYY